MDLLLDNGVSVHLAHPAGNEWGKRRVKNERDARDLADYSAEAVLPVGREDRRSRRS